MHAPLEGHNDGRSFERWNVRLNDECDGAGFMYFGDPRLSIRRPSFIREVDPHVKRQRRFLLRLR